MPLNDDIARRAIGAPWTISVTEGDQHMEHDIALQDVDRALDYLLVTYGPEVGALNAERITLVATRDHETHTFIRYFQRHFRGVSLSGTELLFSKPRNQLPDLPPLLHFCNSRYETIATFEVPDGADPYTVAANHLPPWNPSAHAVPNDERARTREIAQRLERPFAARFLDDSDTD